MPASFLGLSGGALGDNPQELLPVHRDYLYSGDQQAGRFRLLGGGGAPWLGVPHKPAMPLVFLLPQASWPQSCFRLRPEPPMACSQPSFDLEGRTLNGDGKGGRQREGQRPFSDRLINRAPDYVQLTLGVTWWPVGEGQKYGERCTLQGRSGQAENGQI